MNLFSTDIIELLLKGVEERCYDEAKWVSTNVMGMVRDEATSIGFQRLFKYITGTNDKGMYGKSLKMKPNIFQ